MIDALMKLAALGFLALAASNRWTAWVRAAFYQRRVSARRATGERE